VRKAAKKVADWQLQRQAMFNQQWTFAALYDGLLAASKTTGDPRYREAVEKVGERYDWKLLDARFPHADDMALGQAYLDLAVEAHDPNRSADTQAVLDRLVVRPDDPAKLLWWWCDALFMAPPVYADMAKATGDKKYLDFMDREWDITTKLLYDKDKRLYSRDGTFLNKKDKNGEKLFWSRGNGWVMGGIVRVLKELPKDSPLRPKYEAQLKDMAAETLSIRRDDGLWSAGMLDNADYTLPEVSGSAFITYALAYGVNEKILDKKTYWPAVEKAWGSMLTHVYTDGRLGAIQPVGAAPGAYTETSSYNYGVGAWLLAGSEIYRTAK
jgi:rhamnogalacturonyl hydrolase YesR